MSAVVEGKTAVIDRRYKYLNGFTDSHSYRSSDLRWTRQRD
jgi:hypothetical protein